MRVRSRYGRESVKASASAVVGVSVTLAGLKPRVSDSGRRGGEGAISGMCASEKRQETDRPDEVSLRSPEGSAETVHGAEDPPSGPPARPIGTTG